MGGLFKSSKPDTSAQDKLAAEQAAEKQKLQAEEEKKRQALRRKRTGRASLITSSKDDAGLRDTLGG